LHRDRTYTMPAGVCLALVATSDTQMGAQAFQNRQSYESYYDHSSSHKSFFGLKRSSSHTHEYMKKFYEEDMAFAVAQIFNEKYTLALNAPLGLPQRDLPLHPKFIEAVNALPSSNSPKDYRDFINRFGTHFVSDVTLGARLQSQDYFHRCLLYKYGDKSSEKKSGFNLLIVSKKSAQFGATGTLDAEWTEYSKSLIQFEGGNPFYFTPEKYDDWLLTTSTNPAPISKTLDPISDLVHKIDPSKGLLMQQAVTAYVKEKATAETTVEAALKALDPKERFTWCPSYPHQ